MPLSHCGVLQATQVVKVADSAPQCCYNIGTHYEVLFRNLDANLHAGGRDIVAEQNHETQQPRERQTERMVFYITPTFRDRVAGAVRSTGMSQADWCRRALEVALEGPGGSEPSMGIRAEHGGDGGGEDIPRLMAELAVAQATIAGQERLLGQQRERQGMSDALNVQLSQHLDKALGTADRLTLALPAPADTSEGRGFNWRFWER